MSVLEGCATRAHLVTGIFAALEGWAAKAPHSAALLEPGCEPTTYGALWCEIERFALALEQAGIDSDGAVAVVLSNGAQLSIAQLGVSRYCACAPLSPALTRSECEACLALLRPSGLVADNSSVAALEAAAALAIPILEVHTLPGSAGTFTIKPRASGKAASANKYPGVRLIFRTSGTTGNPKLVPLTEKICAVRGFNYVERMGLTAADRLLCMTPPFLHQGWIASLSQLLAGGSVVQAGSFASEQFPGWLTDFAPTWYGASPAVHRAILSLLDSGQRLWPCPLRFVRSSGAPLGQDLIAALEQKLGVPVLEGYGLTETGSIAGTPLDSLRKPRSAGKSTGTRMAIRDCHGYNVLAGEIGEIVVRGAAVMDGYCSDTGLAGVGLRDGWFHTGDLGTLDEEGYLFVKGRINECINRGGEKVLPLEIEDVLNAHPAVAEAVVFGAPHPSLGEEVACAIVLKPNVPASAADLREFAAVRLSRFKIPRRVFFVTAIPRNESRKPDRGKLRELALVKDTKHGITGRRPPSPLERRLIVIWKRILNTAEVDLEADFFDLGGDSLNAALMLAATDVELGGHRAVRNGAAFFREPTVAALAEILTALDQELPQGGDHGVIALQPSGSRSKLFCIPASDEDPFYLRHLANHLGPDQPFFVLNTAGSGIDRPNDSVEAAAERTCEALRRLGAQGPYLLAGHCYGGMVAIETARQLAAEGEMVALVALFDVPTPGYPKVLRHWRKYATAFGHKLTARKQVANLLQEGRDHLKHLLFLTRRKIAARLARRLVHPQARSLKDMAAIAPAKRPPCPYQPKNLAVPVVQFMAAEVETRGEILEDVRTGWKDFALAGFTTRTVPGGHDSMLLEPHAQHLAADLGDILIRLNLRN